MTDFWTDTHNWPRVGKSQVGSSIERGIIWTNSVWHT